MWRLLVLTVFGSLVMGACILPSLDLTGHPCPCISGYVCEESTQTCVTSPGAGGATTSSTQQSGSSAQTTTVTGQTGSGTGGQPPSSAPPLVISGDVGIGTIAATVTGAFRLELTADTNWQIQRWFDLPTSDVFNLAAETQRNLLLEPVQMEVSGVFYGVEDAAFVSAKLTDETPARAIIENTVVYPPGGPFSVHNTYTIYASGRVGVRVDMTNTTATSKNFDTSEVDHTSVNESVPWATAVFASNRAVMFQRSDGAVPPPTILSISHNTTSSPAKDFLTNYYWDTGGQTIGAGQTFERTGELQIGLGSLTLPGIGEHADDVMQPGLVIVSGGTMAGNGYDPGAAAYAISATTGQLKLAVSNAQNRYAPAFVIDNWTASTWSLSKNGMVVASSTMPDGPSVLAYQDTAASRLILVSTESIPPRASDAERTFVLDPQ